MFPFRRFLLLFCMLGCPLFATAEDGVYLTKSEFDEFLRQYRQRIEDENDRDAAPKFSLKPCTAWKKGKFTFTLYGYVNLSMSYDSSKVASGDYCAYAFSPEQDDGNSFQVDAKSSRFGVLIDGPGIPGWCGSKTQACYEFDFQGAFSVRSRPGFMMRKAYVAVSDKNLKLLAGQDWEIISPLYPMTLNYTAGACVGNNGYRRAMVRADRRFDLTGTTDLLLQFGLTDNVLRDASGVSWASANAGSWPVLQGRIAYAFAKGRPNIKPVTVGVSAHLGEQRFQFQGENPERKYMRTWSLNVDLDAPLTERLRVQSEFFVGENLAGTEGGVLQGVDLYRRDTIRSQGGWVGVQYAWTKKMATNLCFLIDDPYNEDLLGGNGADGLSRTYNHCVFVNVLYNWNEALMTGLELSFWKTHWQRYDPASGTTTAMRPGEPTRVEFVTRYTF